ncbi:MAG: 2-hydroxyacid dehydrogenase [Pseudomonadota bacterium]
MAELLLIGDATDAMLRRLDESFVVHRMQRIDDLPAFLSEYGERIEYVATNGHDGVRSEIMTALPGLKLISCYGVGYDTIDVRTCVARGIMVTHTPGVLNDEVATTAVMLMLACRRDLIRNDAYVRAGRWEAEGNAPLGRTADNRKVGILGFGRIGRTIAGKLGAFNATVFYHARSRKDVPFKYYADLVEMAHDAEVLICITPGGSGTHKIVGRAVIDALGPQGTLINVGRGSVVDETEMIAALQDGRLGWAGLDVFEAEPRVPAALRTMSNVVLLPHVGSATVETRAAMGDLVVDNLLQFLASATVKTPVPECAHMAKA